MISSERRQYVAVRWSVVIFSLLTLSWGTYAAIRWAPMLSGQVTQSTCGCQAAVLAISPWLQAGAVLIAGLMAWLWLSVIRNGWLTWKKMQMGEKSLKQQSRRLVFHESERIQYWLVTDPQPQALTVGWWRPAVFVTTDMIQRLTKSELRMVLRHEQAHVQSWDPLWAGIVEICGRSFSWLPWMRSWVQASYGLRELVADEVATGQYREAQSLSSAMIKLADQVTPLSAVAFSPNADRVDKLLDQNWHPQYRLWRPSYVLGLAMVVTGLFFTTHFTKAAVPKSTESASCQETHFMCRQPHPAIIKSDFVCFNHQVCLNLINLSTYGFSISAD